VGRKSYSSHVRKFLTYILFMDMNNQPDARFLSAGEGSGPTIVLASYPRSGNSLLRKVLEHITGVITGSDTRPGWHIFLFVVQRCVDQFVCQ
jgi:hypothetical protein